ncbi:MAG: preprotein translocase subunit SecG [Sphingomonadales bacterium]|nr:preprotein translocase subunit SecG [Sphingomonadales bacterium]
MLFKFLLVVHAVIATALVGVILMQRSEGGGLAGGGNPAGLVSARGAADLLTRTTAILASLFILLSIGMAAMATFNRAPKDLDTSLATPASAPAPVPAQPVSSIPMADPAATPAAGAPATKPQAEAPKVVADKPAPKPVAVKTAPKVEQAPVKKVEVSKAAAPAATPAEPAPAKSE